MAQRNQALGRILVNIGAVEVDQSEILEFRSKMFEIAVTACELHLDSKGKNIDPTLRYQRLSLINSLRSDSEIPEWRVTKGERLHMTLEAIALNASLERFRKYSRRSNYIDHIKGHIYLLSLAIPDRHPVLTHQELALIQEQQEAAAKFEVPEELKPSLNYRGEGKTIRQLKHPGRGLKGRLGVNNSEKEK